MPRQKETAASKTAASTGGKTATKAKKKKRLYAGDAVLPLVQVSRYAARDALGRAIEVRPDRDNGAGKGTGGSWSYFDTIEEAEAALDRFCSYVVDSDYKVVPSVYFLWRYLVDVEGKKIDVSTVRSYYEYDKRYQGLAETCRFQLSSLMSAGALMGRYEKVSSIFALKNQGGWVDRRETTVSNTFELADTETAQKLVRSYLDSLPPAEVTEAPEEEQDE